jgi:predicted transcriptional regulator
MCLYAMTTRLDILPSSHHDAIMRTTIDLPADLHDAVSSIAVATRRSMNRTIAELIRRGLAQPGQPASGSLEPLQISARTGLPLMPMGRVVTPEDVRAVDDES